MALIAIIGFLCLLPIMIKQNAPWETFLDRTLNLIVIAVPPALPATMACGMIFAIRRLKEQRIFCISPPRVNIAGRVTSFVFDKTGTLTEDGLSVQGYTFMNGDKFSTFSSDFQKLLPSNPTFYGTRNPPNRDDKSLLFLEACASCTAITYVNGSLIGDPLDVKMFLAT